MADGPLDGAEGVIGIDVKVSGTALPDDVLVQSIRVTHDIGRIPEAVIVIQSGGAEIEDFGELDSDDYKIGKEVQIAAFYGAGAAQQLFQGVIASARMRLDMDRGQSLELLCRDKALALTLGQGSAQYLAKKDSDVMTALVSDAGLTADIAATPTPRDQLRVATTDWAYLRLLADRNGMIVCVTDGKVTVKAPDIGAAPVLTVTLGQDMLAYDVQIDAQRMLAKAEYLAWDSATQDIVSGEHSTPTNSALGDVSGADIAAVFGDAALRTAMGQEAPSADLQALAKARLLRASLDAVHGTVRYPGSTKAGIGDVLEIKGASDRFSGKGFVSGVRHSVEAGQWTTVARLGLPLDWVTDGPGMGGGAVTPAAGLTIGTVTKVSEDPDGKLRLQVKLPLLSGTDDTLIWARFATPYASKGVGIQFLPEIGDEVVVGHIGDDPDAPVILGVMHSGAAARPVEATEDNFIKQILTREKLKITFDDEKKILTLETPEGQTITLDDEGAQIALADSNGNTLTMDADGITLDTPKDLTLKAGAGVTIEAGQDATLKGTNVSCEGDMGFTGKGGSQAELNGGGQAVVKGAMVMIN